MEKRYIRLSLMQTGQSVIAEMLDEEAPQTCKLVWSLLPLKHSLIHGRFSGMEVFILLDECITIQEEMRTNMPLPGEICYWTDSGSSVTSGGKPDAEILMAYGRGVILRGAEGVPSFGNLFARIPGDWKYDWLEFANACDQIPIDGSQLLRIERAD